MPRIVFGLGANLGNREENIATAIAELKKLATPDEEVLCASLIDTAPQDCPPGSPRFLNTVVDLHIEKLRPLELLEKTQAIEKKIGRLKVKQRNAPRLIDIDILLFGDEVFSSPELELPHPRIAEREFVLQPLLEIRPNYLTQPAT